MPYRQKPIPSMAWKSQISSCPYNSPEKKSWVGGMKSYNGETWKSFVTNPGGYIGFFDPATGGHETYSLRGDCKAAKRLEINEFFTHRPRKVIY